MDPSITFLAKVASFYLVLKILVEATRLLAYMYSLVQTNKAVKDLNTLVSRSSLFDDNKKAN